MGKFKYIMTIIQNTQVCEGLMNKNGGKWQSTNRQLTTGKRLKKKKLGRKIGNSIHSANQKCRYGNF